MSKEASERIQELVGTPASTTKKKIRMASGPTIAQRRARLRQQKQDAASRISRHSFEDYEVIYTDPMISQGINLRSILMFKGGIQVRCIDKNNKDDSDMAKKAREHCEEFIANTNLELKLPPLARTRDMYGKSALEIVYDAEDYSGATEILDLVPVADVKRFDYIRDPMNQKIMYDDDNEIIGYEEEPINTPTEPVVFDRKSILMMVRNPFGGYEPLSLLDSLVDIVTAKKNAENGMANAIRLAGFPIPHVKVGKDNRDPSKGEIDEANKHMENMVAGMNYWITGKDTEYSLIQAGSLTSIRDPVDYYVVQVCSGLGLPRVFLLGVGDDANRAVSEQEQKFMNNMLSAESRRMAHDLESQLFRIVLDLAGFRDITVEIDFGEISDTDENQLVVRVSTMLTNNVITINEARDMLDLEELGPEFDVTIAEYQSDKINPEQRGFGSMISSIGEEGE